MLYNEHKKEYMKDYNKKYRKEHLEQLKEYSKKYRSLHKDKLNKNQRKYYEENKDKYREIRNEKFKNLSKNEKRLLLNKYKNPEYFEKNKVVINTRKRNKYAELRSSFLIMYGNKCSCCGESIHEFLTIEHKNGQKGKKKDTAQFSYRKATKEYRPDLYEILCWNCNCSKGRYGYCPHQK